MIVLIHIIGNILIFDVVDYYELYSIASYLITVNKLHYMFGVDKNLFYKNNLITISIGYLNFIT